MSARRPVFVGFWGRADGGSGLTSNECSGFTGTSWGPGETGEGARMLLEGMGVPGTGGMESMSSKPEF